MADRTFEYSYLRTQLFGISEQLLSSAVCNYFLHTGLSRTIKNSLTVGSRRNYLTKHIHCNNI